VKTAVEAGGGKATLAADGAFETKPDVAIVVFGENPYAEGVGDLKTTLEYQPGAKTDLALLKSLKAKGVPVVAVFLSGRPLWVNPEINASDAFVAAWLPGSEGGGIADVLIGDAAGKPRHDFHGKLSFSWPKTAAQFTLNKGDKNYDPLFAYGYGLTYAKPGAKLGKLSEVSGVKPVADNAVNYFVGGKTPPPFEFRASPSTAVQLAPVDAGGVQEAGRQVTFSGDKPGKLSIVGERPLDLSFQTNADMALSFDYRLDTAATKPVTLAIGAGRLDVTPPPGTPTGQWASVKIPLKCFQTAGTDVAKVVAPFELATAGTFQVSIANVKLTADPAGAVCPAKAQ